MVILPRGRRVTCVVDVCDDDGVGCAMGGCVTVVGVGGWRCGVCNGTGKSKAVDVVGMVVMR